MSGGLLKEIIRALEAHRPRKFIRDRINRLRYGAAGPLSDMAVFPDPRAITDGYLPLSGLKLRRQSYA